MTPDLRFFVALESRVWQSLADGDAETDRQLLDPQFVGVYSSGFASRAEHAEQLINGPTVSRFSIDEPRLLPLAPDAVLLSYRATFARRGGGRVEAIQTMYVSSVWKRRGENWLNVFSQDTTAGETA